MDFLFKDGGKPKKVTKTKTKPKPKKTKGGNFLGSVGELVAPTGWESFVTTAGLFAIDRADAALRRGKESKKSVKKMSGGDIKNFFTRGKNFITSGKNFITSGITRGKTFITNRKPKGSVNSSLETNRKPKGSVNSSLETNRKPEGSVNSSLETNRKPEGSVNNKKEPNEKFLEEFDKGISELAMDSLRFVIKIDDEYSCPKTQKTIMDELKEEYYYNHYNKKGINLTTAEQQEKSAPSKDFRNRLVANYISRLDELISKRDKLIKTASIIQNKSKGFLNKFTTKSGVTIQMKLEKEIELLEKIKKDFLEKFKNSNKYYNNNSVERKKQENETKKCLEESNDYQEDFRRVQKARQNQPISGVYGRSNI